MLPDGEVLWQKLAVCVVIELKIILTASQNHKDRKISFPAALDFLADSMDGQVAGVLKSVFD